MSWRVYLLLCADGTYYCGIARDVARRLAQHNGERAGGARYTAGRRPVALLAASAELDKPGALRLEAKIKRLPRKAKLACLRNGS